LQLTRIPKEKKLECDQEVMHSLQDLAQDKNIPYNRHTLASSVFDPSKSFQALA